MVSIQDTADKNDLAAGGLGRRVLRSTVVLLLVAVVGFELATTVVTVDESEYAIVERLGEIVAVYDRAEDRGLHFKLPWPIDSVRRFDRRVQLLDPPGREMFTRDKENVTVDAYVCWKIAEPHSGSRDTIERPVVRFFRSLGSVDVAEQRLDSRVRSVVNTRIGQVELIRLLNVADSVSGPGDAGSSLLEKIGEEIRRQIEGPDGEASLAEQWGIDVVDVRIKRINFPAGNRQAVFERMRSERKKIAEQYRSAGMAEARLIESRANRLYNDVLAKARADAERIRGKADAEAVGILNAAHAQDREFYRVLQTLDTYRRILNEKTTLVLSASSNLMKLLTDGVPELPAPPAKAEKPVRAAGHERDMPAAGESKTGGKAATSRRTPKSGPETMVVPTGGDAAESRSEGGRS